MRIGSDEIERRAGQARELLSPCGLCPRRCGIDRPAGEAGFCRTGAGAVISSWGPHFGEEPELVGRAGSGTIFFAGCNLGCLFCQNYDISHLDHGSRASPEELASVMLSLAAGGCHNINLVTPTHVLPTILDALAIAQRKGLDLPIVYNCGGYERIEALRLLEGIVDIYMPDAKFASAGPAQRYCQASDYPDVVRAALREMHRQVGDLDVSSRGIARRGLLVRHLVMPGGISETGSLMRFIADELSGETYVNVMAQYRPAYRAHEFREIARRIKETEYRRAVDEAVATGLHRGFPRW